MKGGKQYTVEEMIAPWFIDLLQGQRKTASSQPGKQAP